MSSQVPTNANDFEKLFDRFVREQTLGTRFDESPEISIPRDTKCADYWFADARLAIELKTLNKNHGSREQIVGLIDEGLKKYRCDPAVRNSWLDGRTPLPKNVARFVNGKVQNSIKGAVRKANSQLLATRKLIGNDIKTVLLVANLHERLFGPRELLKYLSGQVLDRNSPQIDATILISPGVAYSSGPEAPWHYLETAYADGMEHLGDLIEPLLNAWIDFEAAALGVQPVVDMSKEVTEQHMRARPFEKP